VLKDLSDEVLRELRDHLGFAGLILAFTIATAAYVWRDWDRVKNLPGVSSVLFVLATWWNRKWGLTASLFVAIDEDFPHAPFITISLRNNALRSRRVIGVEFITKAQWNMPDPYRSGVGAPVEKFFPSNERFVVISREPNSVATKSLEINVAPRSEAETTFRLLAKHAPAHGIGLFPYHLGVKLLLGNGRHISLPDVLASLHGSRPLSELQVSAPDPFGQSPTDLHQSANEALSRIYAGAISPPEIRRILQEMVDPGERKTVEGQTGSGPRAHDPEPRKPVEPSTKSTGRPRMYVWLPATLVAITVVALSIAAGEFERNTRTVRAPAFRPAPASKPIRGQLVAHSHRTEKPSSIRRRALLHGAPDANSRATIRAPVFETLTPAHAGFTSSRRPKSATLRQPAPSAQATAGLQRGSAAQGSSVSRAISAPSGGVGTPAQLYAAIDNWEQLSTWSAVSYDPTYAWTHVRSQYSLDNKGCYFVYTVKQVDANHGSTLLTHRVMGDLKPGVIQSYADATTLRLAAAGSAEQFSESFAQQWQDIDSSPTRPTLRVDIKYPEAGVALQAGTDLSKILRLCAAGVE